MLNNGCLILLLLYTMYIIKSIFGTFNCLLIAVIRLLIRLFLPTLSVIYFRIKLFCFFFGAR